MGTIGRLEWDYENYISFSLVFSDAFSPIFIPLLLHLPTTKQNKNKQLPPKNPNN